MDVGLGGILAFALGLVGSFGIVLALFVVIVRVARFAVAGGPSRSGRREVISGVELLDERLALGQITREEYDAARRALGR